MDGLVQNQVTGLYQDQHGFIWVGTKAGVSRFDGVHFKNYSSENGLLNGWVNGIIELNNTVYCYNAKGIAVLKDGQFKQLKKFKTPDLFKILLNRDSTKAYILFKNNLLLADKKGVQPIAFADTKIEIINLELDSETDNLILLANDGIYRYANEKFIAIVKNNNIGQLFSCSNSLYFATPTNASKDTIHSIYKLKNGVQTKIYESDTKFYFRILNISKTGKIFFQTDFPNWKVIDTNGVFINEDNLPKISCNHMLCDKEGNYWLGTETGLFVTQSFAFRNYGEKSGIPTYIWSIIETKDSAILLASYNGELCVMKNSVVTIIPRTEYQNEKELCFYMNGIRNSRGDCYIPTNNFCLRWDGIKFYKIPLRVMNRGSSSFCTYEDIDSHRILFGTNEGLFIYDMNSHITKHIPTPHQNILFIESDKFNQKWVCTSAKIYLFEHDSLKDLKLPGLKNETGAVSCKRDPRGNMWLATKTGFYLYNWHQYIKISNSPYYFLSLYKNKYLIAGTITGFLYIDLDAFYAMKPNCYKFFDRYNGFTGIECGQNGTCIDSRGNVWIPTSESVVKFMPYLLKKNTLAPNLKIYSFEISGKDLKWINILNEYADITKPIELTYDKHNIKISFMGISLSCPEKVKYKTRLRGYDNSWSAPTTDVSAVFTNLPPGNYTFEIEACNADGVWTANPLQIHFNIHPAFWQTWWFYPLLGLILIGIMMFLFRLRLKSLKKKVQVKQKMSQLEMDLLHMQIKPHFTSNSLMMIKDLIYDRKYENALEAVDRFGVMLKFVAETTRERFITLEEELMILRNYINFQKLNPSNSIDFVINIADNVVLSEIVLPPILLQPFIENSIQHGLKHKKGDGLIKIDIEPDAANKDYVIIAIFDNGVGRNNASKLEADKPKHKSIGIKNSTERLNNFNKNGIQNVEIFDREDGTEVKIRLTTNYEDNNN